MVTTMEMVISVAEDSVGCCEEGDYVQVVLVGMVMVRLVDEGCC